MSEGYDISKLCAAGTFDPRSVNEEHIDMFGRRISKLKSQQQDATYCQHTGWWVRMLYPEKACPDCGKYLPR